LASNKEEIKDILTLAIELEIETYQLYTYMAANVANPEICKACEDFAKRELEHKAKLEQELIKIGEAVPDFKIPDYIFEPALDIYKDMDYKDLLAFAINKKEKCIKFYENLSKMVDNEESKKLFLSLIEEETKQKACFEKEYQSWKP